MSAIRHKHVSWRDDRPRFTPGPTLRAAGYVGTDLRWPDDPPADWKPTSLAPGAKNLGRWFSKGEAVDWSEAFQRSLKKKKERPAAAAPVRKLYTIADMVNDWLRSPKFSQPRPTGYSPATIEDYKQKLRIIENDHMLIWNAPARTVEKPHLRAMFEEIWNGRPEDSKRNIAALPARGLSSARGAILALSACYSWALLIGKVRRAQNPALKLEMPKPEKIVRFATRPEVEALVKAADLIGKPEWGDMILLALWTGQRQGDRVTLIDRGTFKQRRHFRQSKTGVTVAILSAPQLEARLEKASERRRAVKAEALLSAPPQSRPKVEHNFNYVVMDETRWVPFSGDHWSRCFAVLRQTVLDGIPDKLAPMPSIETLWDQHFRATAVVWMALAGSTIPQIISVTGHEMESATRILKHYLARHPEMADEAIRRLIAWYDAGGETEMGI